MEILGYILNSAKLLKKIILLLFELARRAHPKIFLLWANPSSEAKKMTCGLGKDELTVLYALYRHHCFNDKASYNLKQISAAFQREYGKDPNDVAKSLAKKGYAAQKRKKDIKYYIIDIRSARFALHAHEYNVPGSR